MLQIKPDRTLVVVERREHGTEGSPEGRAPVTAIVTANGVLHLDNVRAESAQHRGGVRTCHISTELQHPNICQGELLTLCSLSQVDRVVLLFGIAHFARRPRYQ